MEKWNFLFSYSVKFAPNPSMAGTFSLKLLIFLESVDETVTVRGCFSIKKARLPRTFQKQRSAFLTEISALLFL